MHEPITREIGTWIIRRSRITIGRTRRLNRNARLPALWILKGRFAACSQRPLTSSATPVDARKRRAFDNGDTRRELRERESGRLAQRAVWSRPPASGGNTNGRESGGWLIGSRSWWRCPNLYSLIACWYERVGQPHPRNEERTRESVSADGTRPAKRDGRARRPHDGRA